MNTKILMAVAFLCPMASWAADDFKPFDAKTGLWESAVTVEITGLPAMPEGMGGRGTPRTTTHKVCMTRETFSKPLSYNDNQTCTTRLVSSSASRQEIHVECAQGPNKTTGDLVFERVDAEHIKGTMVSKISPADASAGPAGRTVETKTTIDNKWLAAACGDVKPAGQK